MKADCCCPPKHPTSCGCCEGVEILTPQTTVNRPGLPALSYRIGTHATFLETMKARLSTMCLGNEQQCKEDEDPYPLHPLRKLSSRESDDPAIALLDAWAIVGDVLTFYQERIANEGYLRTATERRSVLELAQLVGYRPRPGVASSVYLAYSLDENFKEETIIAKGARSQSVPGPGELPQSFETSEDLKARAQWNNLKPRLTQPQTKNSIEAGINIGDGTHQRLYLKGISTNLKSNDPILIDFGNGLREFHKVREVVPDAVADHTQVLLQKESAGTQATATGATNEASRNLIESLALPPSVPPANSKKLVRNLNDQFGGKNNDNETDEKEAQLLKTLNTNEASYATSKVFAPALKETLRSAAANAQVTRKSEITVYALRVKASLFGHNAPKRMRVDNGKSSVIGDWPIIEGAVVGGIPLTHIPSGLSPGRIEHEEESAIHLDARYDSILPDGWIVVETPETRLTDSARFIVQARNPDAASSRAEYGLTGPTTRIEIDTRWIQLRDQSESTDTGNDFEALRKTAVYAQSEPLELAEEPITQPVCGKADELIELDDFYECLEAGRWVIVSGEREIDGTSGVRFSELSMLSTVSQSVRMQSQRASQDGDGTQLPGKPLPGDKTHTFIKLAEPLVYCFKRDTVKIYGNVVLATHGETRTEILGSGDGSKPLQRFTLKQPPLTFVPAPNPSGVDSTLKMYVNDVQWHESNTLFGLNARERRFVTQTDDEGKTTVIFGNGREGARLPTGIENVRAVYRNGIGKGGNVKAEQISLLSTRPLGAKEVINPLTASGGADKETRDQARKHAPLAVMALDRLVSVQDYEDFTRVFAGIGKALAAELSDGRRQIVHLTIAGVDDIPIETHSDLYRNLTEALRRFGDPNQPFRIDLRELKLLALSARVRLHPDYLWEKVEPKIRAALLDTFSFERREVGQDALLSEAISAMQRVAGVQYVDIDTFGGIAEKTGDDSGARRLRTPAEISDAVQTIVEDSGSEGPEHRVRADLAENVGQNLRPAQLAYLSPLVPATLILNEAPR